MKKNIRILLLGGGKRVSLAQRFIVAGDKLNCDVEIFSYELDNAQPISLVAEIIVGKKWSSPAVKDDILRAIKQHNIHLVISNVDPAIPYHALLRAENELSAQYTVDVDVAEVCRSKLAFQKASENLGLPIIPCWDGVSYPLFVKPDYGSASIGAVKIDSAKDLENSGILQDDAIFQEFIDGDEFTVDAYVTQDGLVCGISPRMRSQTLGGESVVTETVSDANLIAISNNVILKFRLRGPLTLQFIKERITQRYYLMEVNTRFAGGVICSIEAGYDYPLMLLNEFLGNTVTPIKEGKKIIMKRYFAEAFYAVNN